MEAWGIVGGMIAALALGFELGRALPFRATSSPPADGISKAQLETELERFQLYMDDAREKMDNLYDRTRKRVIAGESPHRKAQDRVSEDGEGSSIPPKERARLKARERGLSLARSSSSPSSD